jgi:hypothetical protein
VQPGCILAIRSVEWGVTMREAPSADRQRRKGRPGLEEVPDNAPSNQPPSCRSSGNPAARGGNPLPRPWLRGSRAREGYGPLRPLRLCLLRCRRFPLDGLLHAPGALPACSPQGHRAEGFPVRPLPLSHPRPPSCCPYPRGPGIPRRMGALVSAVTREIPGETPLFRALTSYFTN